MSCASSTAMALDEVVVRAPGAPPELANLLERASLTRKALDDVENEDERLATAEALGAARGEYREMLGALYSEGYYGGEVSVSVDGVEAAELSLVDPPARINRIVVTVQPGPQFLFSRAEVVPMPPDTDLPDGYATGEIARSGLIRRSARVGIDGWRNAGHAKAVLASERIIADHRAERLSSTLEVDPGPRLRFGELRITGNQRVRTERIRAIAGLPTGEVYDPEALDDAAERLRRTGAFRAVTLKDAEQVGPGDTLAIEAQLSEEKRRRLGAGLELSSTEGIGVSAFWMHRNLLGGAENLRFDLGIRNIATQAPDNGTDYTFEAAFRRPATPFTDVDLLFYGRLAREDEPGYLSDTAELGGGFERIFSDELRVSVAAGYRASRVEDAFGERSFQMLVFPAELTFDTRDVDLDPTRGVFVQAEVKPFYGVVDIDSGARTTVDARTYFGFGEERDIVLAGRAQVGSLFGPEIDRAPSDYLFFAGGGGSVRGQPFQSLGTGERDDRIIGGRSFVGLSGEVRAYVRGPFGVVAFYDAGYIGAEDFYDGSGAWMSGAGLGVRYDTGFGPIRVDVATPVDGGPDDADPVNIYIGIGQAF